MAMCQPEIYLIPKKDIYVYLICMFVIICNISNQNQQPSRFSDIFLAVGLAETLGFRGF